MFSAENGCSPFESSFEELSKLPLPLLHIPLVDLGHKGEHFFLVYLGRGSGAPAEREAVFVSGHHLLLLQVPGEGEGEGRWCDVELYTRTHKHTQL